MATKKTQINNPLFGTSEVDPTMDSNSSSSSDASYVGPMTRRRTKDLAEVYALPDKAEKVLNWKAELNIQDMCEDTWRWQKNNPMGYAE